MKLVLKQPFQENGAITQGCFEVCFHMIDLLGYTWPYVLWSFYCNLILVQDARELYFVPFYLREMSISAFSRANEGRGAEYEAAERGENMEASKPFSQTV